MAKSTITLASGKEMPLVGFGLWKVPKETAADTVYNVTTNFHHYILRLTSHRPSKPATDYSTEHTTTKTKKKQAKAFSAPSPMVS
jgi:hypothetical protein